MIFDILKQRWLRKEFIKLQNTSRVRKPQWPKSLVIVFDATQFVDVSFFKKCCENLQIPLKNLTLLGFTKDVNNDVIEGINFFDTRLIKWNGGVSSNDFKKILENPYDLQINFFEDSNIIINYVSLKLSSGFKVGYATHEENSYDLAINLPLSKQDLFISEINKYLKILNN